MIPIWQPFLSSCFLAIEGIEGWVESDVDNSMVNIRDDLSG
jgi:hypothetical protein